MFRSVASPPFAGPSVLEVFNNLLRHLRISVDSKGSNQAQSVGEIKFQDAIVNTIGESQTLLALHARREKSDWSVYLLKKKKN